jgi:hypothetical protein
MSFSSLNARTLLFARPVFTVIENMACRNSSTQVEEEEQEKNKTRKRKWGREDKKKIRRTPSVSCMSAIGYRGRNTALSPSFIDVVSHVSVPPSIYPR